MRFGVYYILLDKTVVNGHMMSRIVVYNYYIMESKKCICNHTNRV